MFVLDAILGIGSKVIDRLVPDKNKAQDQDHDRRMGQQAINVEMAKSSSLFVSGARAFVIWAFGGAIVYKVIVFPFAAFYGVALPPLETDGLMQFLIFAFGGM